MCHCPTGYVQALFSCMGHRTTESQRDFVRPPVRWTGNGAARRRRLGTASMTKLRQACAGASFSRPRQYATDGQLPDIEPLTTSERPGGQSLVVLGDGKPTVGTDRRTDADQWMQREVVEKMSSLDGGVDRWRGGGWGRVKGWKSFFLIKKSAHLSRERKVRAPMRPFALPKLLSFSASTSSSASASEQRQHSSDNSFGFLSHNKRCGKEEEILKTEGGGEEEGKERGRGKKGSGPAETNKQNQVWVDGMNRTAEDWRRFERSSLAQEQATHTTARRGEAVSPHPCQPCYEQGELGQAKPGRPGKEGHGNRGTLRADWTTAGMAKCPSWQADQGGSSWAVTCTAWV